MLQKILSSTSFLLLLVGISGLTGTWEQEVTDPDGVLQALLLIVVGVICAIWALYESGSMRNRKVNRKSVHEKSPSAWTA